MVRFKKGPVGAHKKRGKHYNKMYMCAFITGCWPKNSCHAGGERGPFCPKMVCVCVLKHLLFVARDISEGESGGGSHSSLIFGRCSISSVAIHARRRRASPSHEDSKWCRTCIFYTAMQDEMQPTFYSSGFTARGHAAVSRKNLCPPLLSVLCMCVCDTNTHAVSSPGVKMSGATHPLEFYPA
jgi:hypothetical protein